MFLARQVRALIRSAYTYTAALTFTFHPAWANFRASMTRGPRIGWAGKLARQPSYPILQGGPRRGSAVAHHTSGGGPPDLALYTASYVWRRRVSSACNVGPAQTHARPMWARSSPSPCSRSHLPMGYRDMYAQTPCQPMAATHTYVLLFSRDHQRTLTLCFRKSSALR